MDMALSENRKILEIQLTYFLKKYKRDRREIFCVSTILTKQAWFDFFADWAITFVTAYIDICKLVCQFFSSYQAPFPLALYFTEHPLFWRLNSLSLVPGAL